jgi:hypothetical protein
MSKTRLRDAKILRAVGKVLRSVGGNDPHEMIEQHQKLEIQKPPSGSFSALLLEDWQAQATTLQATSRAPTKRPKRYVHV